MPISLNHLENDVRSATVYYAGESARITYRPSESTPNKNAARVEAFESDGNKAGVALLCALLISWDVLDNEGVPLPITPEVLSDLPDPFLTAILNACQEDMYPKKKSGQR